MSTIAGEAEPAANEFLVANEVARMLRVSPRHIYRMEKDGRIPEAVRLGSAVRWRRKTIDDWIAEGCPTVAV